MFFLRTDTSRSVDIPTLCALCAAAVALLQWDASKKEWIPLSTKSTTKEYATYDGVQWQSSKRKVKMPSVHDLRVTDFFKCIN